MLKLDLNTSYVSVKYIDLLDIEVEEKNLNTSYVSVKSTSLTIKAFSLSI